MTKISTIGRRRLRSGVACCLGLALAGAALSLPAGAQQAGMGGAGLGLEENSESCGFTFFTDGDDRIDFRQSAVGSCFDMLDGADMLVVDPDAYPQGVEVFTGPGRDTTWTSDGPDHVIDRGAEDAEIRTYGGDDVIELHPPVDEDPFRSVETTGRTEIRAGAGANKIQIGKNVYSNAFARVSPNAWVWTEAGASDEIEIDCGRPQDPETFDLRVMEVPENAEVKLAANGCGVGLFGQLGRAEITQVGGRFALRTQGEKFRVRASDDLPEITGSVIAGTGAFLHVTRSDPKTKLSWQGRDEAVLRADLEEAASGGHFDITSTRGVLFEGRPGPAAMTWVLQSEGVVEVGLEGRHDTTAERFELTAPRVFLNWRYEGGSAFPEIATGQTATVRMAQVEPRVIEFYQGTLTEKAQAMFSRAMGFGEDEVKDARAAGELPDGVLPLSVSRRTEELETGFVSLSLDMRRLDEVAADCFSAKVVDLDGNLPTVRGVCHAGDEAGAVVSLKVDDARAYERIILSGPKEIVIEMNGTSGMRVDRLAIDL